MGPPLEGGESLSARSVAAGEGLIAVSDIVSDSIMLYDAADGKRILSIPNPDQSFAFGSVLDISDGILVANSALTYDLGIGAVYAYDLETGALINRFINEGDFLTQNFGFAVSTSQGKILYSDITREEVYLRDPFDGDILQNFSIDSDVSETRFGWSIDLLGNEILIGAQNLGAAFLYDALTGDLMQDFFGADMPSVFGGPGFGSAVALSQAGLAISEPFADRGEHGSGLVNLYERSAVPVSEPGTATLLVFGAIGIWICCRRGGSMARLGKEP